MRATRQVLWLALGLAGSLLLGQPAWGLSTHALEEPLGGDDPYADALYADEVEEDLDGYEGPLPLPEPDPLEGMNRAFFGFNQHVDRFVVEPIARAYGWAMPDPAKRAVLRVFSNLNSTSIFVNDVLQLEPKRAGITLGRFAINSTVGVAGILDVADSLGIEGHHSDFGQTLARAGLGSGPYLVLPMLGSTTARDAVGGAVDLLFRPQTYFLGPAELVILGTSSGLVTREAYIDELEALRESSVDFYATMRNIYFQRRAEQLRQVGVGVGEAPEEPEPAEAPGAPEEPAEAPGVPEEPAEAPGVPEEPAEAPEEPQASAEQPRASER